MRFSFSPDLLSRRDALKNAHFTSMLTGFIRTETRRSAEPYGEDQSAFIPNRSQSSPDIIDIGYHIANHAGILILVDSVVKNLTVNINLNSR